MKKWLQTKKMLILIVSFLFVYSGVAQENMSISGKLTNEDGEPIPGATVVVKGTTVGTVTDVDGLYKIEVPSGENVLLLSFVGFKTTEVAINNRSVIDATLQEDLTALEEVVVVGYGEMEKSDLTGAVVRADIESFREQPNTNIMQSLQGNVPGLNVGVATSAGETPSISIRGQNSLSGSSEPLIVIDGIIYRGNLRDINSMDVASIDVLKDASSTAIYGSQAANGVILITTKSGSQTGVMDKPVFNYSGSFGLRTPAHVPESYDVNGYIGLIGKYYWEQARLAPDYIQPNPGFDPVGAANMANEMAQAYNEGLSTDWWDLVTQTGQVQTHTLSMRGNTAKSNYYISGSYTDQRDIIINDEYKRVSGRVNFENQITSWLKLGMNSFVTSNDLSGAEPSVGNGYDMPPLSIAPYDENGELNLFPTGLLRTNPLLPLEQRDLDKVLSLSGIAYAIIEVPWIEGLKYRVNYANNYRDTKQFFFDHTAQNFAGEATRYNRSNYDWTLDNIVTYKKTFADIHELDVTLLYGREFRTSEATEAISTGFVNQALGYNDLGSGTTQRNSSLAWEENSIYSMVRANYTLMNKYLISGTLRRDGFSGFGAENKFGVFPSMGFGWIISEEGFMNTSWVQFLKLRGSYGTNGNRTIGRYATLAEVVTQPSYVLGDGSGPLIGQYISNLANQDLTWETTTGLNLGLDFSFLKNRITGSVDYYNTVTNDLLYEINVPTITGFSDVFSNLGEIKNNGLEITLNTINIKNSDFEWNSTFNFARNRNEIVSILGRDDDGDGQEDDLVASGLFIGEPIGAIYDYETNGIYNIGDDIPAGWAPGNFRLVDQNGDDVIEPVNDRVIRGYEEPAYRFSINNSVTYKNLTFRVYLYSIQGGNNYYYGDNSPHIDYYGSGPEIAYYNMPKVWDFWLPENPDAEYPRLGNEPPLDARAYKQRSFVRLQNISLAYNFGSGLLESIGIRDLKVFVNANNLATWTNWKGWDPETGQGIIRGGRPLTTSFTAGIDFSF